MAKYLIRGNYLSGGMKGLMQEGGSKRAEAIEAVAASVGGTIDAILYSFGPTDVYVIADIPDNAAAAAISMMVNASELTTVTTEVLMTPAEIDEAAKRSPGYRAPGM